MSDEQVLKEILNVLKRQTVSMEDIAQTMRKIEKDGIDLVPLNEKKVK